MKKLMLLLLIVNLFACRPENKKDQTLSDNEWNQILDFTFGYAQGTKPYVFKNYENIKSNELLAKLYTYSTDLGYEISDSILNYIENRKNYPITNTLDTMLNISFVYDTNTFNENLIIYSEPFYINKNIICISMTNILKPENRVHQFVFFFKKEQKWFKIIELYDVNKDQFYRPVKIKK